MEIFARIVFNDDRTIITEFESLMHFLLSEDYVRVEHVEMSYYEFDKRCYEQT